MAKYNAIKIERGSGGFGGPLTVKPEDVRQSTDSRHPYRMKRYSLSSSTVEELSAVVFIRRREYRRSM